MLPLHLRPHAARRTPARRTPARRTPARRSTALAAAALLVAGVAAVSTAGTAGAATPATGTVSPTSPKLSYTAGPFAAPNVTGTAGAIDCSVPMSCDDFRLTVDTPAGYSRGNVLKVAVSWPTTAADFDVYLLDAAGGQVASAASSADPEVLLTAPDAGTYTVRVVPYAPAGQSIQADISLQKSAVPPPPPPPANTPAAGFVNYPAPGALPDAHNAGEPSIGYDTATSKALYQASLSTYRVGFDDSTSPATATYADRSAAAATGCPGGSTTSLDPILATDRATGRTVESQLLDARGVGSLSCLTSDDGDTWSTSQGGGFNSGVDHQTLGWGNYAPKTVPVTGSFPRELYYCSQDIADASCSTSSDGGTTFGPAVPMYTLLQCTGIHGHVKVAPDGTAYVPNKDCGGHPAVVVSTDNGLHWAVRPVPLGTAGASDPSVAVGEGGTVYLSWNGGDNHVFTAVSRDRGENWSDVQDVGAQLGIQNTVFPAAVAGDDDRAAVAFLGTTTGGDSSATDVFTGVWQLYVASTYDGGKTWTTGVASKDPVQRGSVCTNGTTCGSDRNLLDFIDATVDPQGRVLVGYADGCTAACVTTTTPTATTTGYRDALATIARQSSGLRLYRAADPLPDLVVSGIQVRRDANGVEHVSALVKNRGAATATGAVTRFYDGCSCSGTVIANSAPVTLAAGASSRVEVVWSGATKTAHTVTAVVDPANKIRESRENNNKCQATVTVR